MDWERERSYEVPRLVTIAVLVLFIGVYLGDLDSDRFPFLFALGAAAMFVGFFVVGHPFRPRVLQLGEVMLRYHLPAGALLAALALRLLWGTQALLFSLLFVLAAAILGQELRGRALSEWRFP